MLHTDIDLHSISILYSLKISYYFMNEMGDGNLANGESRL